MALNFKATNTAAFAGASRNDPTFGGTLVKQRRVFSPGKGGKPDTYTVKRHEEIRAERAAPEVAMQQIRSTATNSSVAPGK